MCAFTLVAIGLRERNRSHDGQAAMPRRRAIRGDARGGRDAGRGGRRGRAPEFSALGTNRYVTVAVFDGRVDVTDARLEGTPRAVKSGESSTPTAMAASLTPSSRRVSGCASKDHPSPSRSTAARSRRPTRSRSTSATSRAPRRRPSSSSTACRSAAASPGRAPRARRHHARAPASHRHGDRHRRRPRAHAGVPRRSRHVPGTAYVRARGAGRDVRDRGTSAARPPQAPLRDRGRLGRLVTAIAVRSRTAGSRAR